MKREHVGRLEVTMRLLVVGVSTAKWAVVQATWSGLAVVAQKMGMAAEEDSAPLQHHLRHSQIRLEALEVEAEATATQETCPAQKE